MDDMISRQAAIDRATKEHDFFRGAVTVSDKARRDELLNVMCWLGELPPAQPDVPDINVGDMISRQVAISAICNACGKIDCDKMDKCEKLQLPSANNSEIPNSSDTISRKGAIDAFNTNIDELVVSGKENADAVEKYINRVIDAIKQLPPAQPTPDQNGDLWITVPDIDEVTCIYVQESKSKFCRIFYEEQEQPDRIEVGDEVAFHHDDGRPDTVVVVTYIGDDGYIDGMDGRGTQYANKNPKRWTKTGRHFDIASILKEMKS